VHIMAVPSSELSVSNMGLVHSFNAEVDTR
jgi:hypothetical protein